MKDSDSNNRKDSPDDVILDGWFSPVYTDSRPVRIDAQKAAQYRCVCFNPDAPEIECYKVIRTRILQRTKGHGHNTIMITSALPGEGKTLTTINLGISFAKEFDHTVLLVDCDLRQQMIHQYLGFDSPVGLVDAFRENRPLTDLIVWPGVEKLTIISGGSLLRESAELIESPRMKTLIQEIKTRYPDRYIFFDTPPVLSCADAIGFAPLVDGVIMVVQAGKTSIDDAKRAASLIPPEKFLGFIINRQTGRIKHGYGYGYGYGYGAR